MKATATKRVAFTGGNYVDFGKQPQYELGTSDFTIEAWIRMPQGFGSEANAIVTNQNYLNGAYNGIHFLIGNHKLGFSVSEGAPEADAIVYGNSIFLTTINGIMLLLREGVTVSQTSVSTWTVYRHR